MINTTTLRLEDAEEGVMLVTLDRPERMNAQTPQMFEEFEALAAMLQTRRDIRVIVMTGAGRAFCAGYDLDEAARLTGLSAGDMYARQSQHARSVQALRKIPQPLIAAVNGAAAGGGFSLALIADIRLAAPEARFNAAFVRIGLSAGDLGCSWMLPRIVGAGMAAELLFTGRFVEAEEAVRIGLVNRIVPSDELMDDAMATARQIVANSPLGVELSKSVLRSSLETPSFDTALEIENRGQALATQSEDMAEALAAFVEKRSPQFTGKGGG